MKTIHSEIKINASPTIVWETLTRFNEYPNWNPFIISLKGEVAVGNKIEVQIKPVDKSIMTFKPIVLTYIENKEISWEGNLFMKGLFDGRHMLKLIDNKDGSTTFIQSEVFSGVFVPFFTNMIEKNTLEGFHLMNEKLNKLIMDKVYPITK